jgi:S1-C subfamily serine protease
VRRFGLDPDTKGLVIVGVESGSRADRAGLEVGMVITDVANQRVSTVAEFRAASSRVEKNKDLVVRILKGTQPGFRVILSERAESEESKAKPGSSESEPKRREER